jgi:hypothetical protein
MAPAAGKLIRLARSERTAPLLVGVSSQIVLTVQGWLPLAREFGRPDAAEVAFTETLRPELSALELLLLRACRNGGGAG